MILVLDLAKLNCSVPTMRKNRCTFCDCVMTECVTMKIHVLLERLEGEDKTRQSEKSRFVFTVALQHAGQAITLEKY